MAMLHPFDPARNKPRPNADGSVSTELTRTVQLPDGSWANVPSLWWGDGQDVHDFGQMNDDQIADFAGRYEAQSGAKFPRFTDLAQAEAAAKARSAAGGGENGTITSSGSNQLDRIAAALKAADAAGNVDDAKRLAAAYRQMQGGSGVGRAINPYTDGSATPLVGKVSDLPSQRPSFGDEAMSFGRGVIEGIPVLGPTLSDWRQGLDANLAALLHGGNADEIKAGYKVADEELRSKTGGARFAGNLTGSVAALAPLGATAVGGRLLGTAGTLGERLAAGSLSGAAISGADTAARGGDLGEVARNAALGAGLGLVFPTAGALKNKVANSIAKSNATTAAIANAPAASELKTAASDLFKQVDQAGVVVDPKAFEKFVIDAATRAKGMRISEKLDPKAYATFQELGGVVGELRAGRSLTLSDLHNLRQIAQRAAVSSEGRDSMFAGQIVDALDDFATKPGSTTTANGPATGNQLLEAISTWGRAKRVGLVEDAIERAKNTASGFENGIRIEFRKLLNNKRTSGLFTAAEREEMEKVVRGTTAANLAKLIGKFGFGPGANGLGGFLGGTAGFTFGGPLGAAAMALGASGARKASEKITERAAERAAKVVATPNIPAFVPKALPSGVLPPALLPLETTKKKGPIEILVTGGAR